MIASTPNLARLRLSALLAGIVSIFLMNPAAQAQAEFELLDPPLLSTAPTGLEFVADSRGRLNLVYLSKHSDDPGQLKYLIHDADYWSSPVDIDMLQQNKLDIAGITSLSNGFPMLLLKGDNTDYAALLNLSAPPPPQDDETVEIIPGMSNADLETLLDDNQRLFYSFLTNGGWSSPIPVGGSSRADNPVLASGTQGNALVLFSRDVDKDVSTSADRELLFTGFNNNFWSTPTRLDSNSLPEFNLQLVYAGGQFVAVWTTDEDNDFTTRDDWRFQYAVFDADGQLASQGEVFNQDLTDAVPLLVESGGQPTLFWQSEPISADDSRRPLMMSTFSGSWSAAVESGLIGLQILQARIYPVAAGEMMVYFDGGVVVAALNTGGGWQQAGVLADLNLAEQSVAELTHYYDTDASALWLAISAHVPAVGETGQGGDSGDGVYAARIPLSYDLAPVVAANRPYVKILDEQVVVDFSVGNLGAFPSPGFSASIRRDNVVIASLAGQPLAPGAVQEFSHSLTMDQATIPLVIEVNPGSGDSNTDNDQLNYSIKILPDFQVRGIERQGSDQLVVDISERKGISAPPVVVDFFLIQPGRRDLIATGQFDTNIDEPMIIQSAELSGLSGDHQILAQVNPARDVEEDDYSNNQAVISFEANPDFIVSRLDGDPDKIYLQLRNQGNLAAAQIDLLVTDDPAAAASAGLPASPWFYQDNITLAANGEVDLEIVRAGLPDITGSTLYAVVNPIGQYAESDRNNNQAKLIVATTENGVPPGGEENTPLLGFSSVNGWCQNLQVRLANSGTASAISPRLELLSADGLLLAQKSIPIIRVDESVEVLFNGLSAGDYSVRAIYRNAISTETVIEQTVTLAEDPGCVGSSGQDVELETMVLLPPDPGGSDPDALRLRLTLSLDGYNTSYRKPLLRLPLRVEVKQNAVTYFLDESLLYLPPTSDEDTHTVEILIPSSGLPAGYLNIEAQLQGRNDENDSGNNFGAISVDVGNL